MSVKLRPTGWELGGDPLPWIWGHIPFWDLEHPSWRDVLRAYHQAGHAVVSTSILPSVHQTGPEAYVFSGGRPDRDASAFIREAAEAGLKVFLWLGPRAVPGVEAAGYPLDLLKDEHALARDPLGRTVVSTFGYGGEVFSLPSLTSERVGRLLQTFAQSLQPVLTEHIHPDGPVIGLGLTLAPGWGSAMAAYSADYQFEAVARYREFLKRTYKRIEHLNRAYGSACATFHEVEPPRGPADPGRAPEARHVDWGRFREEYFIVAAERLYETFSPLALNRVPLVLASLPASGLPARGSELMRMRCFDFVMPERVPVPSETAAGAVASSQVLENGFLADFDAEPRRGEYALLSALSRGVRGWDAVAPAGAGMIPGFLCDRAGHLQRPRQPEWEALLEHSSAEGLLSSRPAGDLLLMTLPEMERSVYLQTPPDTRTDLAGLEPDASPVHLDPEAAAYREGCRRLQDFLTRHHFPFLRADGAISLDTLRRVQVLLFPGCAAMSSETQAAIAKMVESGLTVMIAGDLPGHPEEAAHAPLTELAAVKPKRSGGGRVKTAKTNGRLLHLPEWSETKLLRVLLQTGVQRPLVLDDSRVQVTCHRCRGREFIAVHNPLDESVETTARREGKFVLKDFWNANKFLGGSGEIRLVLAPRSVKFWELLPC